MVGPPYIITMSTSDNDDLGCFSSPRGELARRILRVKRNDAAVTSLRLNNVQYSDEAWGRLGDIVGQSELLDELNISHGDPDVVGLCAGLRNNRCLRRLDFLGVDLRKELRSLVPFIKGNPHLCDIALAACNLGPASINILSEAISDCSLERLNLRCNYLGAVDLDVLIQALSRSKKLTQLRLSCCGIGLSGCTALTTLLRDRMSNLMELRLNVNSIDDDCTVLLAGALLKNTKLKELALNGNIDLNGKDAITAPGWLAMLNLVCDTSSIDSVLGSNHTLCRLGMTSVDLIKTVGPVLSVDDANLLRASMEANDHDNKMMPVRCKMVWGHARRHFNLGKSFIHTGAMPQLLAWFGAALNATKSNIIQYHDPPLPREKNDVIRLDSIFRIVSSMPELATAGVYKEHHIIGESQVNYP